MTSSHGSAPRGLDPAAYGGGDCNVGRSGAWGHLLFNDPLALYTGHLGASPHAVDPTKGGAGASEG
eukprot:10250907-Alexandrium_andersonii.AAC.1